jgi:hypothetical protein
MSVREPEVVQHAELNETETRRTSEDPHIASLRTAMENGPPATRATGNASMATAVVRWWL